MLPLTVQKQKVVVIGHSTTLRLSIVRAVAELGCEITVVVLGRRSLLRKLKSPKPYDCYSKYVSRVLFCQPSKDTLIQLLLDKCTDAEQKVILLPTSDFSAVAIDDNKERLDRYFAFPHIADTSKSVHYWMNKEWQKDVAREVGLNVPNSRTVEIQNSAYSIPEGIEYPCFTKALVTLVGAKSCFSRCNNEADLKAALDAIAVRGDVKVLVEDFKEIDTEYAVLGFSDSDEVVIPAIVQIVKMSASHFGVAMTGKIIPTAGFEPQIEQFKAFVRRIGFVGVFDIDFYYSGGKYYFGEMNLRPGGSGYAITKLGVNLPGMLVRHLRGESTVEMNRQITATATFVNERMCEDDWYQGHISSSEYRNVLSAADISFVFDEQDPKPQQVFARLHIINPVEKHLRKILR